MRNVQVGSLVTSALVLAASTASADDVMRCGSAIVDLGMVAAQVVAKCGTPQSKEVGSAPVKNRSGRRSGGSSGTTRVERWTYDRGYGQLPALLTFEHGKLKSIELLARR